MWSMRTSASAPPCALWVTGHPSRRCAPCTLRRLRRPCVGGRSVRPIVAGTARQLIRSLAPGPAGPVPPAPHGRPGYACRPRPPGSTGRPPRQCALGVARSRLEASGPGVPSRAPRMGARGHLLAPCARAAPEQTPSSRVRPAPEWTLHARAHRMAVGPLYALGISARPGRRDVRTADSPPKSRSPRAVVHMLCALRGSPQPLRTSAFRNRRPACARRMFRRCPGREDGARLDGRAPRSRVARPRRTCSAPRAGRRRIGLQAHRSGRYCVDS